MLWDLIFDFYVQHVFGGYDTHNNQYQASFGYFDYSSSDTRMSLGSLNQLKDFNIFLDGNVQWSVGNYFSFIATIISMVVIVLICCALIKKIYNMCAHIIG